MPAIEPHVIEYLKTPPARAAAGLADRAHGHAGALGAAREGNALRELGLGDASLTDDQLLDAMMAHPILINRPIVVSPLGVKLCRPSEAVLDLLPQPQRGGFHQGRRRARRRRCTAAALRRSRSHERSDRRPAVAAIKAPSMGTFERYLTLWVALCIVVGIALGQLVPGVFHVHRRGRSRAGQSAGRRAGLADGHSDAAQDRPRGAGPGRRALARHRRHGRHQLAGEALLDGAAGVDVHRASVPAVPAGRSDRQLHGGPDPAGGGALHGHGVRLVEPRRGRAAFHARAGGAQRHDHGRGLRADRRPAARPVVDHGALGHADAVGRALHRRAGDRGAALAAHAAGAGRAGGARANPENCCRRSRSARCC